MTNYIKEHKAGIIGTIIFHAIIIGLFILFGYSTPLPLPDEEGILINFGDADEGFGQIEPKVSESIQEKSQEEIQESVSETTTSPTEDRTITQDYEEAPAIEEQGVKEEKPARPAGGTEKIKPEPKKEEKEEVKEERKVNENALFPGRNRNNDNSSGEGEIQGQGNQGSTTGSLDTKNRSDGNSIGTGGYEISLGGRNPEHLPKPNYNQQIEGKVVVEITVDKYGNVTKAVPGAKGSTTLDASLLEAAKRAALKAKFEQKLGTPFETGTITYFFKLQ